MSLNDRKLARHLGVAAQAVQLPMVQLHVPVDKLARGPLQGGRAAPNKLTGYAFWYQIDPPVGGFANADALAQIPDTAAFKSVITPTTFVDDLNFWPGHWQVMLNFTTPQVAGVGYYVGIYEWDEQRKTLAGMGGGSAPFLACVCRAATVSPQGYFQFQLYSGHPWHMRLYAFGTHADANLGGVSGVVSSVHLLDDGPSAQ